MAHEGALGNGTEGGPSSAGRPDRPLLSHKNNVRPQKSVETEAFEIAGIARNRSLLHPLLLRQGWKEIVRRRG